MNALDAAVAKSYWRCILRGTRTIDDVPEELRDAVRELLEADEKETV